MECMQGRTEGERSHSVSGRRRTVEFQNMTCCMQFEGSCLRKQKGSVNKDAELKPGGMFWPKQAHSCTGASKKWTHIEGAEECCDRPERNQFNVQITLFSSGCSTHIARTQQGQGGISQQPKRRRLQASKWRSIHVENCLSAWRDWKMQLCIAHGRPKCACGAGHAAQRRHPRLETGREGSGASCALDIRKCWRVRMLAQSVWVLDHQLHQAGFDAETLLLAPAVVSPGAAAAWVAQPRVPHICTRL